jgi:topoisomerase-4 subunit A
LARLEGIKIEQELAELRKDAESLQKLLGSDGALRKQVAKEFDEDAKKYGDARRTLIEAAERTAIEAKVLDEPVTVIVSEQGFLRARTGHGHDAAQFTFRSGDALYGAFEVRTVDQLIAVGSNGRVYSVPVAQLPSARGDGAPASSMIELEVGTRIVGFAVGAVTLPLFIASNNGFGFACQLGDMVSRQKAGKQFITVDDDAAPLRPAFVQPDDDRIACLSANGRLLVFAASEVKALAGGGRGVTLMQLEGGEKLLAAQPCSAAGVIVSGIGRGDKPVEINIVRADLEAHTGHRARKGSLAKAKLKVQGLRRAR